MNKDQIIGSAKQAVGDWQARLGRAIGSTRQRGRGLALKLEGRAQSSYGDALAAMASSGSGSRKPAGGP